MGVVDSTKNTALKVSGRAKQTMGVALGNRDLEARGVTEELTANARQAANQLGGAIKSMRKALPF